MGNFGVEIPKSRYPIVDCHRQLQEFIKYILTSLRAGRNSIDFSAIWERRSPSSNGFTQLGRVERNSELQGDVVFIRESLENSTSELYETVRSFESQSGYHTDHILLQNSGRT